jgi:hypothetical protein
MPEERHRLTGRGNAAKLQSRDGGGADEHRQENDRERLAERFGGNEGREPLVQEAKAEGAAIGDVGAGVIAVEQGGVPVVKEVEDVPANIIVEPGRVHRVLDELYDDVVVEVYEGRDGERCGGDRPRVGESALTYARDKGDMGGQLTGRRGVRGV